MLSAPCVSDLAFFPLCVRVITISLTVERVIRRTDVSRECTADVAFESRVCATAARRCRKSSWHLLSLQLTEFFFFSPFVFHDFLLLGRSAAR